MLHPRGPDPYNRLWTIVLDPVNNCIDLNLDLSGMVPLGSLFSSLMANADFATASDGDGTIKCIQICTNIIIYDLVLAMRIAFVVTFCSRTPLKCYFCCLFIPLSDSSLCLKRYKSTLDFDQMWRSYSASSFFFFFFFIFLCFKIVPKSHPYEHYIHSNAIRS